MVKKNILVTGGAGGIGSAICKKFDDKEFNVIVLDNDKRASDRLISEFPNIKYYFCDVTNLSSVKKAFTEISKEYSEITHLISVAGHAVKSEFGTLENIPYEAIKESINLNLVSHMEVIKTFLPLLKKDDSIFTSIVLISSINGIKSFGLPAYSAAKSGMYGIVKSLSKELASMGIRINAISPGTVVTPNTLNENKNFSKLLKCTLLNRFPMPSEIAEGVYTFAQRLTSATGQFLTIDAGQSIYVPDID